MKLGYLENLQMQNRLVILPAAIGDTVYFLNGKDILEGKIASYSVNKRGAHLMHFDVEEKDVTYSYCEETANIGKTIFFSKEDAWKKYMDMDKNNPAKIELKKIGGPFGDGCSCYDVELSDNYTVEILVQKILTERPQEWGYIHIVDNEQCDSSKSLDVCEYRDGVITKQFRNSEYAIIPVRKAKAEGGYSRMDYVLAI